MRNAVGKIYACILISSGSLKAQSIWQMQNLCYCLCDRYVRSNIRNACIALWLWLLRFIFEVNDYVYVVSTRPVVYMFDSVLVKSYIVRISFYCFVACSIVVGDAYEACRTLVGDGYGVTYVN